MSELRIMAGREDQIKDALPAGVQFRAGDTKLIWDAEVGEEVDNARETFNRLKKKGYAAYSVKKGGEKGELLTEFDAKAEKIIMTPRMVGG